MLHDNSPCTSLLLYSLIVSIFVWGKRKILRKFGPFSLIPCSSFFPTTNTCKDIVGPHNFNPLQPPRELILIVGDSNFQYMPDILQRVGKKKKNFCLLFFVLKIKILTNNLNEDIPK
jgi:hypothetical protein